MSGSVLNNCSAARRLMPSATSRACAPSCRFRSSRRSSAAAVSTAVPLVSASWVTRLVSAALRRARPECTPIVRGTSHTPNPKTSAVFPTSSNTPETLVVKNSADTGFMPVRPGEP